MCTSCRIVIGSICVVLLGTAVPAMAQTGTPRASTNDNAVLSTAASFIQDAGDKAVAALTDLALSPEQRQKEYSRLLRDSFDVPTLGRFVLGRAWLNATAEQRQEFLGLFENLVIKIYANRLASYKGERLSVTGARQENDRDFVVTSEVLHPRTGAPPTHMDWRVRKKGNKFAILDVAIEGVSQSVSQREEYAAVLNRSGGQIDALLAHMRAQIQAINQSTE